MALNFETLGEEFAAFVADPTTESSTAWAEANGIKISHTPEINGNKYHIVRYDKSRFGSEEGQLTMTEPMRLLRSIIIHNGQIVCVSLPKCQPNNDNDNWPNDKMVTVMEEGPMVNVFYVPTGDEDVENKGWQITTRSVFGARNSYFDDEDGNKITFREMFLEAMPSNLFENLDRNMCYSFVVRHPKNRDVFVSNDAHLVLVAAFSRSKDNPLIWNYNLPNLGNININIRRPMFVSSLYEMTNQDYLGLTVTAIVDGQLVRWKKINGEYKTLRKLRGTQPKLMFHYLALRKQKGLVGKYLNMYPEHSVTFAAFRDRIHSFTSELYSKYRSCYIKRSGPLNTFEGRYKQHMFNLHSLYKDSQERITFGTVVTYVNRLEPAQLMYVLNWERHSIRHKQRERNDGAGVNEQ